MRYNEVSMKASHNSYERDEEFIDQLTWKEPNYNCGCGALELDISQSSDGDKWSVAHEPWYGSRKDQLSKYLNELTKWHQENPGHDVVTLHLDFKSVQTSDYCNELDNYIREHLEAPIYTPGELMGNYQSLQEGAIKNGWPSIEELKGKFIICVTGDKAKKEEYSLTLPKERLCFADKDMAKDEMPDDPNRVFYNYHIYHRDRDQWMEVFMNCADKPEAVIRAYEADSEDNWNDSLYSGCNLIATNKISNHQWAKVGESRFVELKPLFNLQGDDDNMEKEIRAEEFGPDVILPEDTSVMDIWAEVSSTDAVGLTIDKVKKGDIIEVISLSDVGSFADAGNPILAGCIAITAGILQNGASYLTEEETQITMDQMAKQAADLNDALSEIKTKWRDGYGQDPGSGHYAKNEGGVIVCMPKAKGALYATSENYLKGDAKYNGRKEEYFSDNIKAMNSFFPCRLEGGLMAREATEDGVCHVLAFDSKFGDNGGKYTVKVVVTRPNSNISVTESLIKLGEVKERYGVV